MAEKKNNVVSFNHMVNKDNLSIELLKGIYELAYFDVFDYSEDEIRIEECGVGCYVGVIANARWISLGGIWSVNEGVTDEQRHAFMRRFIDNYIMCRPFISEDGDIIFEGWIPVDGGITKKAIVQATKTFLRNVVNGISELDTENIF